MGTSRMLRSGCTCFGTADASASGPGRLRSTGGRPFAGAPGDLPGSAHSAAQLPDAQGACDGRNQQASGCGDEQRDREGRPTVEAEERDMDVPGVLGDEDDQQHKENASGDHGKPCAAGARAPQWVVRLRSTVAGPALPACLPPRRESGSLGRSDWDSVHDLRSHASGRDAFRPGGLPTSCAAKDVSRPAQSGECTGRSGSSRDADAVHRRIVRHINIPLGDLPMLKEIAIGAAMLAALYFRLRD